MTQPEFTSTQLQGMGIPQLSREIFKRIKELQGPGFRFTCIQKKFVELPADKHPEDEQHFEDAWFRLVDRNLIRWWEHGTVLGSYHLTERGRISTYHQGVVDEPDEVIAAVEKETGTLDPTIRQYLGEAFAAYHDQRLIAAQFFAGAVAERIVLMLHEWMHENARSPAGNAGRKNASELIEDLKARLKELKKKHKDLPQIGKLGDCIEDLAHAYRRDRNDAGHPVAVIEPKEESLSAMLQVMKHQYLPRACAVLALRLDEAPQCPNPAL
jgi:hypothetical protein